TLHTVLEQDSHGHSTQYHAVGRRTRADRWTRTVRRPGTGPSGRDVARRCTHVPRVEVTHRRTGGGRCRRAGSTCCSPTTGAADSGTRGAARPNTGPTVAGVLRNGRPWTAQTRGTYSW